MEILGKVTKKIYFYLKVNLDALYIRKNLNSTLADIIFSGEKISRIFIVFCKKIKNKTEFQPIIFSENEITIEDSYFSNIWISGKKVGKNFFDFYKDVRFC